MLFVQLATRCIFKISQTAANIQKLHRYFSKPKQAIASGNRFKQA